MGYLLLVEFELRSVGFSKGDCVIFKPGSSYQEVARFKHGMEAHIGSPAFVGRRIYFRGKQALWCFGQ